MVRSRSASALLIFAMAVALSCRDASPVLSTPSGSNARQEERVRQQASWPPDIKADCEVKSAKIPEGVLREMWGAAGLEVDFYIFGCRNDIEGISDTEKVLLEKEVRAILREYEGFLYWAQAEPVKRGLLVARLNGVMQKEAILDLGVRDIRHIDEWPRQ